MEAHIGAKTDKRFKNSIPVAGNHSWKQPPALYSSQWYVVMVQRGYNRLELNTLNKADDEN